jgi:DNA-binding beta-propeller fold protein YncE
MSYVAGSSLAPGTMVAGFRIEGLIGRGGMGSVYRAQEEELAREVALKVIAPELAQDERFRERFLRESKVAASLDHPNVVPIYRAGEEEGVLYLAMRYVEGTDLGKLLASEGALAPGRCLELLAQVAEALDAAHERGLVHRDVKPSNVLIGQAAGKEHCYLGDFGLTKRAGSLSGVSVTGDIVGTLEYVAPEQITGEPLDARADVYSLGCVLYECLAGQSPFPRATDVALLWAHVHEEPAPPSQVRPELPAALDPVLARALAKEPARRYDSASELVASARLALGLTEAAPARARSRRALLAGAALLVLVAAALLAALLLTRGSGALSVSPNSVGVIDPASNEIVGEVPVGIDPEAIAVGEGGVWVANVEDQTVSRVDPTSRELVRGGIAVGSDPSDVAVADGSVWVALGRLAELVRINPGQNKALSPIPALGEGWTCTSPRASLTVGSGAVWFVCETGGLGRVDLRTGKATRFGYEAGLLTSPSPVLPEFSDAALGLGSLWIVNRARNTVVEVDPATRRYQREITVGSSPSAVAVGEGSVWVANFDDDTVTRIEVTGRGQTVAPVPIAVGDGPVDVAVGEGGVWVVSRLDRQLTRIDPETGEVVATIAIGSEPQRVAAGDGAIWVTVRRPGVEAAGP